MTAFGDEVDARKYLLLRLLAEAFQVRHLSRFTRRFQLFKRINMQEIVEGLNFLRPQAGNANHLQEPGRRLLAQLLEEGQSSGLYQRRDLVLERIADPADLAEPSLGDEGGEVRFEGFDGHGLPFVVGLGSGNGFLALQLEQCTDLAERSGNAILVHGNTRKKGGTDATIGPDESIPTLKRRP